LRRLAGAATYLYQDGPRYWYSTQTTVTKLAEDRAEQLKRDLDKVAQEIERRLRADLRRTGDFERVHPLPQSGQDVPDDQDARLVVLGIEHPCTKEAGSKAEIAAKDILGSRGSTPRLYQNTLVFLAIDKTRLQDLDEAVRRYLAWESILSEKDTLDLSPHQVKQAEAQKVSADGAVIARLPEAYRWLLVPTQASPQAAVEWQTIPLTGTEPLAVRASKKLAGGELLITGVAPTRLRMELDRVPLWRGDHVLIKQLVEDFPRYLYLPRLSDPHVLVSAIRDGVSLLTWEREAFACADSYDEAAGRYRGLRCGAQVMIAGPESTGLLVRPEVARKQQDIETATTAATGGTADKPRPEFPKSPVKPEPLKNKRYHGTVELEPGRAGRDAGRIADEVIAHLVALVGANVRVTLEIEAEIASGAPDNVVRTVTENSRTLKFTNYGFEKE
jgi:hypothetical protein